MSERAADERPPTEAAAPEPTEQEPETAASAEQRVEEDLDELAQAKRERDEYLELAQRTRADFENYRKRVAADAQTATQRGRSELARELIPVLDSLERAIESMEGADENLVRGVVLVLDELTATLGRAGVESYDPTGEAFDPNMHEAVSTLAADGTESGTVIETLDRGYRLDGQVLRPARVVVSS
jgi:molecular chaperone GrpE